ncbi:hypothetical protein A3L04_02880 [Thermococcus chitonophagus]|uniref:Uncharacterized protein n=1 Tax=Thermococcus chitonophagus TaxID=54262 RepID=A0A161KIK9_9EURY|nr:hypothetical protein [Thermococcus chitonophagus]ASJ16095.1 hypothetical protein A3L04_02880 [Thermococcus chitonophagus]CUX77348.1 hypothetical protein CHITON_0569 [Thermococcus chitonophagus]
MDILTIIVLVVAVVIAVLLSSMLISSMLSKQMRAIQAMIATSTLETPTREVTTPTKSIGSKKAEESFEKERKKVFQGGVNEEEILKKLKQVIDEKVQNVLNEAKRKKERLLMLLDVARGYALGFISEDEYNAFLMKVLAELDEFKRLWLARFPSQSDRDRLNQMISYVARTKLPIEVREKGKERTITLSPDEALIRITSNINSALSILDDLIKKRGENPAVTPLEIQLSQEVEKLRKKVEQLEARLQELEAL